MSKIIIYDRVLGRNVPGFRKWLQQFPRQYAVTAGERLKQVESFPRHITKILALTSDIPRSALAIVAVGGGSVLDFAGFVASILKRGVRLEFFPSTWLAAIDAAHGGKTALNVGGVKNQIGTFYPAHEIYLVKSLLDAQPKARATEAMAELMKIKLLGGKPLRVNPDQATNSIVAREGFRADRHAATTLWKLLPDAIRAKERIVRRDPFERNGHRRLLNLGHTMGHILESHYRWPHGKAIAAGLFFALEWSAKKYGLSRAVVESVLPLVKRPSQKIPRRRFQSLLGADKKRVAKDHIEFIFLKKIGHPVRERVSFRAIINEARRQGWVA